MKWKVIILAFWSLCVSSCSPSLSRAPSITPSAGLKVYKDQYLIKSQSAEAWCGDKGECQEQVGSQTYLVSPVGHGWSVIRGDQPASAGTEAEIVPYDSDKDLCKQESLDDCEPNWVWELQDTTPNDPAWPQLWGMQKIRAPKAWDEIQSSGAIRVAVIDTGVNAWPELSGSLIDGYNAIDGSTGIFAIRDSHGHGTHVSGTLCAAGDNADKVVGVTWQCQLLGCRFLSASGGSTVNAIKCIDWAVANEARVLSNSWGGGGYSEALKESIERAKDAGAVFIAAAGNYSTNTDVVPYYPQGYEVSNIMSVGASDEGDGLATFSNYGQQSVDIMAPGVNIKSLGQTEEHTYTMSGTSMSTPHVSGAAALILAQDPSLTPEQVILKLAKGAKVIHSLGAYIKGGRRLDLYGALHAEAGPTPTPTPLPTPTPPPTCQPNKVDQCINKCRSDLKCQYQRQRRCRKQCKDKYCPKMSDEEAYSY